MFERTLLRIMVWGIASYVYVNAVIISDTTYSGVACFKIKTQTSTYYYDKAGAGFAGLVDTDNKDWISYKAGGGPAGEYRGIPNMGLDVFGHPGYTGATSTSLDPKGQQITKATIVSTKGSWKTIWEFWETHARMLFTSIPANNGYWLLYEGTPGGAVGADDIVYRANDANGVSCGNKWSGDIRNTSGAAPGSEWVYFADGKQNRSLFMIHRDENVEDSYYLMDPMTVFGFGRGWLSLNSS